MSSPTTLWDRLNRAKIHIINYQQFLPRETVEAPRLNKQILRPNAPDAFKETPDDVARRVLRDLGANAASSSLTTRRATAADTAPTRRLSM